MKEKTRPELIAELEEHFRKPVFAIVYNCLNNTNKDFIEPGDEFYFRQFRDDVLIKRNITDCIFILNGPGGNVKTSIACSQILRDAIKRYECFVPTVAGSSLCYFILQSDQLRIGEKTRITQIDPLFFYQNKELRAIKELTNQNKEIGKLAKDTFNPTLENLKRVIREKPNVFDDEVIKESQTKPRYLGRLVDSWMLKKEHDSPLTLEDLKKLKVKTKIVPEEVIDIAKILIQECREELIEEENRFVIQTSKVEEEKYLGGYFYL